MGYIDLQCSVTHAWYSKQQPNYIARLLNKPSRDIYSLVYYETCLVIRALEKPTLLFFYYADKLPKKTIFDLPLELFPFDDEWKGALERFISFKWFYILQEREIIAGGDAIEQLLKNLQLNQTIKNCYYELKLLIEKRLNNQIKQIERSCDKIMDKDEIINKSFITLFHRLTLLRNILHTKVAPEWMVLSCVPVLPPALRPMIVLKQGVFTSSDLNHLYQTVINRNNQLASVKKKYSPHLILTIQKRMLQKGVDALLANGIGAVPFTNKAGKVYKSFFGIMKGKKGRFRENLLGKRVDYSGRSVIVVGPSLSINQCGLPREMAIELFQPFLIQTLLAKGLAHNLTEAKDILKIKQPIVWRVLATIIQQHVVILNRAPTLHRLGIQAFQPLLVTERAIHLHPLVCAAFNADFDGDQMAVHLPLALKAQAEARILMLPFLSLLSPAGCEAITLPSQDMLLGLYVLTLNHNSLLLKDGVPMPRCPIFSNSSHVLTAYNQGVLCCHSPIWLRWIPNTCIVNSDSYAIPVENQYEPSIKSKRLSIYEQIQISSHINALLNLDLKRKRMQQVYIFTTVGRVLFNKQIKQAMQSAVREFNENLIFKLV